MKIRTLASYAVTAVVALAVGGVIGSAIGTSEAEAAHAQKPPKTITRTVTLPAPPPVTVTVPPPAPAEPAGPASSFPGSGISLVGEDIEAGTYRSTGGNECYWERLSGLSGEMDDLITNDFSEMVTISSSDVAFKSNRCGTWEKVS